MLLSVVDIVDLFIRFVCVGQLSLLSLYILSSRHDFRSFVAIGLLICLSAYLLLTAPIPNQDYGYLRGILLLFTEFIPYLIWLFAFSLLNDNFQPQDWSAWLKILLISVTVWFIYFFGYLQGRGMFHQVNHAIQLGVLLHIIFISIKGLADDLVNARRTIRILLVIYICLYFSFILVLELDDAILRDSSIFSTINASLFLLSTSMLSWGLFNHKFKDETSPTIVVTENSVETSPTPEIPQVYQELYQQLYQTMQEGFYKEMQLTIKTLAKKVQAPEHQLRELINKHLGFRNFSDFLNSYRLPAACQQLQDQANLRKPILTIALELGYGSIATFNRAFKGKMAQTPKEYRRQFQK